MGTLKVNVEPTPTIDETLISPPINSAILLQIAKPKPVPPKLRVVDSSACLKGSKIEFNLAAGMPIPVSFTLMDIFSVSPEIRNKTAPV